MPEQWLAWRAGPSFTHRWHLAYHGGALKTLCGREVPNLARLAWKEQPLPEQMCEQCLYRKAMANFQA